MVLNLLHCSHVAFFRLLWRLASFHNPFKENCLRLVHSAWGTDPMRVRSFADCLITGCLETEFGWEGISHSPLANEAPHPMGKTKLGLPLTSSTPCGATPQPTAKVDQYSWLVGQTQTPLEQESLCRGLLLRQILCFSGHHRRPVPREWPS